MISKLTWHAKVNPSEVKLFHMCLITVVVKGNDMNFW